MVRISRAGLVLGITAILATLASAEFTTGHDLVKAMHDYENTDREGNRPESAFFGTGKLMGFVLGVHDTLDGMAFCTADTVTVGQTCAVVTKYLKDHPAEWDKPAALLVRRALAEAFPCPAKPKPKR